MPASIEFAQASDGTQLDLTGAQVFSYTGDVLDYIELTQDGVTYRQTFTYDGTNLVGISAWVAQ